MEPCKNNPALLKWYSNGVLKGITCTHVDDFLFCREVEFFDEVIDSINQSFIIKSESNLTFKYLGLNVIQNNDFPIIIDQDAYVDSTVEIKVENCEKSKRMLF